MLAISETGAGSLRLARRSGPQSARVAANLAELGPPDVPSEGVKLELLDTYAQAHHGLISWAAAKRLKVSRATWYRAQRSGLFEPLHPNVARLWGSPVTFEQRALAAVWAAGEDAMASHRTAAALWGVERPADDPLDVILPSRLRHSLPEGIIIHRPRDSKELRSFKRNGVPVTSPMRMLLDLGAVDAAAVLPAMEALLSTRVVSVKAVYSFLVRHAKRGRHGVSALRVALEELMITDRPSDSDLERVFARLLADHGLPPAEFHAVVEGFEVDFLITGTRIIIECEGWVSHGLDREQFEFDRMRAAVLAAAGYVIVPVTWRAANDTPATVAKRLGDVVRRWAPELICA